MCHFFFGDLAFSKGLSGSLRHLETADTVSAVLQFKSGVIGTINFIMGIIAGVKILKMTDEEYAACDKATLLMGIPAVKAEAPAAEETKAEE